MTTDLLRRTLLAFALAGVVPTIAACPKKQPPPVPDAEPPTVVDAAPTILEPIVEDAGADADAADAKPHATGTYKPQDPIVSRLKQCCAALSAQAKANGNPPDIMPAVNMCNTTAAALAQNPNAPELNALRPLLKMAKNVPPLCQGL